jgi:hypothetical protein
MPRELDPKVLQPGCIPMPEDISALFTVSVYVEAMLGLLMLHTWVQKLEIKAVAWWGGAHLLRAGSIALFGMLGRLPDVITVDVANALLLTSFAVTWAGARLFGGRKIHFVGILAGAVIWLIASRIPEIAGSVALGAMLSSAIIAVYVWLAAAELWCINEDQLISRLPAFFMLFAQGALFLMRTPLGVLMPHDADTEPLFGSVWLTVLSFQALLFTIAVAFILMAMAKERAARMQRAGKLVHPPADIQGRHGLISRIMR